MMSNESTNRPEGRLNDGWTYRDRIQPDAAGESVLDFYSRRYRHSSRDEWSARIESGDVLLDGSVVDATTRLRVGQVLAYLRRPWHEPDTPRSFAVLFRDDHLVAVAKPSGLPVLPGGHHLQNTLLSVVRARFGADAAPVHRLGRGTSGAMLFALSDLAKRALSSDLRDGRIGKVYRTLVTGTGMPDGFTVETPIGRVPYPEIDYVYAARPDGKPSLSKCRVLHRDAANDRSLIHVEIVTGRPHQIRIHLAAAGHPLVGDPLYAPGGGPRPIVTSERIPLPGDVGYHLHAHEISFTHPATSHPTTVTCLPPPELRQP